jgi:hypothetical protein
MRTRFLVWDKLQDGSLINFLFVEFGGQQIVGGMVILDLIKPGVFGVLVDQGRVLLDFCVGAYNLPGNGRINISRNLDAFDDEDTLGGFNRFANSGEFDVDDFP